jgi:hypothetical protein
MPVLPLALLGFSLALPEPPAAPAVAGGPNDLAALARLGAGGVRVEGLANPDLAGTETAEYLIESAARSTLTYLLPAGPRTVRALMLEPSGETAEAWRLARLRMTWESDDTAVPAGVDLPLGLAFGRVSAGEGLGWTLLTADARRAWVTWLPMPYRTEALLRIDTERPLKGRLRVWTSRGVDRDAGFFRAASWAAGPGRPGALIRENGRGHLAGMLVVNEAGPLPDPDRPEVLGNVEVDGKPRVPLAKAAGLPLRARSEGGFRVPIRGLRGGLGPSAGGPSAVFVWLAADPLSYDRSVVFDARQGANPGDRVGAGEVRVAVFWYSDRPGAGVDSPPAPKRVSR